MLVARRGGRRLRGEIERVQPGSGPLVALSIKAALLCLSKPASVSKPDMNFYTNMVANYPQNVERHADSPGKYLI